MNARYLAPILLFALGAAACDGDEAPRTPASATATPADPPASGTAPSEAGAAVATSTGAPVLRTLDLGEALLVDVLTEGSGRVVKATSTVALHCEGRVEDADEPFVRTRDRLGPERFELDPASGRRPIEGLARALIGLAQGARARVHVPGHLAYGLQGAPSAGIDANADLVFEVEIVEVR